MAKFTLNQQILEAKSKVSDLQRQYLQVHGWECTCNTPGSYWLWRRDFADLDAQRLANWEARPAGPYGKSTKPQPYGMVTAGEDLAISMTERVLDEAIDQDGDPDTPAITADDLEFA